MSETQNARAARMAAEWWADRLQVGDKTKFIEALQSTVESELVERGICHLECDYDPQDHLLDAVHAAGVECRGFLSSAEGILPMKTRLRVTPTELKPREGVGNWTAPISVPSV